MSNDFQGDGAIQRKGLLGSNYEMTFAGVHSFMRRTYTKDLSGADLVVSGVPFDLAVTDRPGTRLGPNGIRAASAEVSSLFPYPWGFDPFVDLAVSDYGDCFLDVHNPLTIPDAITNHARKILASGARMLTLGGDHYITYPLLKAHVEKFGKPLSLIHFDAHCDTWADDTPDSLNHGTMFYKAKEGLIDPKRSVQIGIRTWNDDFMGIRILDAQWVHDHGTKAVIEEVKSVVGSHTAYLTFDIDCLDPAFAPGTGTPVAGGFEQRPGLGAILRGFGDLDICGMDVVEVSPPFDHAEITALAAAHIAVDMICLMRNRKVAGKLKR